MNMLEDVKLQAKLRKDLIEAMRKFINDNNLTTQFINYLEIIRSKCGNACECYMDRFVSYFFVQYQIPRKLFYEWIDTINKVIAPYFAKYLKDKKMYYTYREYVQSSAKVGNNLARIYYSLIWVFNINEDLIKWCEKIVEINTFNYGYMYNYMTNNKLNNGK